VTRRFFERSRPESGLEAQIRELLWEWNPLGPDSPDDPHLPRDEYDWLIPSVRDRLLADTERTEIAAFLRSSARERYGLETGLEETLRVAEKLSALRTHRG
jgi:hypothetical protein